MRKVYSYHGFESAYDLERDMHEFWQEPEFKDVPVEFQGELKVTVEYFPPKSTVSDG